MNKDITITLTPERAKIVLDLSKKAKKHPALQMADRAGVYDEFISQIEPQLTASDRELELKDSYALRVQGEKEKGFYYYGGDLKFGDPSNGDTIMGDKKAGIDTLNSLLAWARKSGFEG